jgi:hypothetical protein
MQQRTNITQHSLHSELQRLQVRLECLQQQGRSCVSLRATCHEQCCSNAAATAGVRSAVWWAPLVGTHGFMNFATSRACVLAASMFVAGMHSL